MWLTSRLIAPASAGALATMADRSFQISRPSSGDLRSELTGFERPACAVCLAG